MIKELYVKVGREYEENQLDLDVDNPRGRYLSLHHPTKGKIASEININGGHLLIGVNASRIFNSFALNIYRENWEHLDGNLIIPRSRTKGCIEFININKNQRDYEYDEVPLGIYTDQQESAVRIEIGKHKETESLWVAISDYSFVNILDNQLIGFWINLSGK